MRVLVLLTILSVCCARHYEDDDVQYQRESYDDAWESENMEDYENDAKQNNFIHANPEPTEPTKEPTKLREIKKRYAEAKEEYDDSWMSQLLERSVEETSHFEDPGLEVEKREVSVEWTEHANSYISGYSSGTYRFEDLASAKEACITSANCGGITQESATRYTLRRGTTVRNSPSGETSWLITAYRDDTVNIEEPASSTKYYFGKALEPGNYIEVYGTYVSGTTSFSVNIRDLSDNYILHLNPRPSYTTVMNSYSWGWQTEVRAEFPSFVKNEEFKITIVMMDDHYKILVNDESLSATFPYRMEMSTAAYLWLSGGGDSGFSWNSIKMPTDEISDVYRLKDVLAETTAALEDIITPQVLGKTPGQVEMFAATDEGSLALLQWQLLRIIDEQDDHVDLTDDTIMWILSDRETLETFMTSGDVSGNRYKKALEILAEIIRQDPGVKEEPLKRRLAVATALTFSTDVHSMAVSENVIDGIAKYHTFIDWAAQDLLLEPFYEVTAWHLRYVIGSWQETEELIWARENVVEGYDNAERIADVTHQMVDYKLYNDDGVSVHSGSAYYYYRPVTLQAIHEIGGVCGAISKFASGMAHAFGIPATPVGQPGHCAYIWYKNGGWTLGNDVGGWGVASTHSGIQYTWMRPAVYFPLMNDAQASLEEYRLSEKMRIASKFSDPADAFELLEVASHVCPQNFALWEDMEVALQEPTLPVETVQDALQDELQAFRETTGIDSNIARGLPVTADCAEDQGSALTEDSGSEWMCTENEATLEIDFGRPSTISEIQIQWWGWSKAENFIVSALSYETGEYSIVKTTDDVTTEGWFNHWSYITGWDMVTTKIKIQLSEGKADCWGKNVLLGMRRLQVVGQQQEMTTVISTGKDVTANSGSSDADALLDDNASTVWEGNSDSSWFEIDLGGICALSDIDFAWANGASPDNLRVSYKVGSGNATDVTGEGGVEQVQLNDLASTIRVQMEGGEQSLEGVEVCGVAYSIKDILKMKVCGAFSDYFFVEQDLLEVIEQY